MTDIVAAVPPLSQSRREAMGCETLYAALLTAPDVPSPAAMRGSEIHAAIAEYAQHLVATRQQTDYSFFAVLREQATDEDARQVLDTFRDSFIFDPESVWGVEVPIRLDDSFRPTQDPAQAVFAGKLDMVRLLSEIEAAIDDWKSYWQVLPDADTFQGKLYPLLLFQLNPALERITFTLRFVRYGGAARSVTYTRADVPYLQSVARQARGRQLALHAKIAAGDRLEASSGRRCAWCPLLTDSCPLGKRNPYARMEPEKRLAQAVWLERALEETLRILKDLVVESGPIETVDDNGERLTADFRPKTLHSYPLVETAPALDQWVKAHPDDAAFVDHLSVSGLSLPLEAKKRAELAAILEAVADIRIQTEFKVGPAAKENGNGKEERHANQPS